MTPHAPRWGRLRGIFALGGLNGLHFLNDGLQAALLVVLPFIARDLDLTQGQVGWVVSACFLLGALLATPATRMIGVLDGHRLLWAALGFCGLCFIATALAGSFWSILLIYLAAGVGFGVFHPIALALISRSCDRQLTSKAMGFFTAAGDVGRVSIVAAVMGLVSSLAWRPLLVTMGVPVAIGGLLGAFLHEPGHRPVCSPNHQRPAGRLLSCAADTRFWLLCVLGFLDGLANASLYVFLPFLLAQKGFEQAQSGVLLSLFFASCLCGRVVLGWLGQRWGRGAGLAFCQAAIALVMLGLCTSSHIAAVAVWLLLLGILSRGSLPLILSLTADRLPAQELESGFALNQMVLGTAATLSPLFLGSVSQSAGSTIAFGCAGGLCALNAVLAWAVTSWVAGAVSFQEPALAR